MTAQINIFNNITLTGENSNQSGVVALELVAFSFCGGIFI